MDLRELTELVGNEKLFSYSFDGEQKKIGIEVIERPIAKAYSADKHSTSSHLFDNNHLLIDPVKAGDTAAGLGLSGYGTAGWNIILNGSAVCLSNWHVLCPFGNQSPLGSLIALNGVLQATLFSFQRVEITNNIWDYALAHFDNAAAACGEMRSCEEENAYPYPQRLSPKNSVKIGDGNVYSKVGARPPICRTGTLVAIGDRWVK